MALEELVKKLSLEDKTEEKSAEKDEKNTEEEAKTEDKQDRVEIKKSTTTDIKQEKKITPLVWNGKILVFFDLETTGLECDCDIVQVSSRFGCQVYNQYVLPQKKISPSASKVNGIIMKDNKMLVKGKPVATVNPKTAMESFTSFLGDIDKPVVLVAHNGHRFDVPRLLRVMDEVKVQMPSNVNGFLDTLPLMKEIYPDRKTYKQEALVSDILGISYDAHNAQADVEALQLLATTALKNVDDHEQTLWLKCFKSKNETSAHKQTSSTNHTPKTCATPS